MRSSKIFCRAHTTPLGDVTIIQKGNALTQISYGNISHNDQSALLHHTTTWLDIYFNNPLKAGRFLYPLEFEHKTDYQKSVYRTVMDIAIGHTKTYGQLAKICGGSPRSIGQALRRNPLLFVVPCHRVTARHTLGGYSGPYGQFGKEYLLNGERHGKFPSLTEKK